MIDRAFTRIRCLDAIRDAGERWIRVREEDDRVVAARALAKVRLALAACRRSERVVVVNEDDRRGSPVSSKGWSTGWWSRPNAPLCRRKGAWRSRWRALISKTSRQNGCLLEVQGLGPYHRARFEITSAEVRLESGAHNDADALATSALEKLAAIFSYPHPLTARGYLIRGRARALRAEWTAAIADLEEADRMIVAATERAQHPLASSARFDRAVAARAQGSATPEEVFAALRAVEVAYPFGHPEIDRARSLAGSRR